MFWRVVDSPHISHHSGVSLDWDTIDNNILARLSRYHTDNGRIHSKSFEPNLNDRLMRFQINSSWCMYIIEMNYRGIESLYSPSQRKDVCDHPRSHDIGFYLEFQDILLTHARRKLDRSRWSHIRLIA